MITPGAEKDLQKFIISWLKEQIDNSKYKTFVVELSQDTDSALTALLCSKTRIPTICISFCNNNIIKDFAKKYKLNLYIIDLQFELNVNNICSKVLIDTNKIKENINLKYSFINSFTKSLNGLFVSSLNRNRLNLLRDYDREINSSIDLLPIGKLFESEIFELFLNMRDKDGYNEEVSFINVSALDLKKYGLTNDEIEWADRENGKCGIITNIKDPVRDEAWLRYTGRQREIIAKIHQLEKASVYKTNTMTPICPVRSCRWLVT